MILEVNTRRRTTTATLICLVVLALVAGGYAYYSLDNAQPQRQGPNHASVTQHPGAIAALPAQMPAPQATLPVGAAAVPSRIHQSKALEFEFAASSKEPKKRFRAYELAHDCAMAHVLSESARTQSWLPARAEGTFDAAECGDLKPGQWDDVERRLELLRTASLAGVHGSWFRVWQEGPDGPLRTVAAGTPYQTWLAQARDAALETGDPFVYAQEAQEWHDKDPQRALVATVIYREQMAGRHPGAPFDPSADPEVTELASTLDKATAAKAIDMARAFVANAKRP